MFHCETAEELPTTPIGFGFPGAVSLWFAAFPTVEGLAAQAAAAALVIGSYFAAERVRRPRGEPELVAVSH